MKQVFLSLLLALCCMGSHAAVIQFDDLAGDGNAGIADGYQGFNWANLGAIGVDAYPGSGYANGVVSYANGAFNQGGAAVTISRAGGFDFIGAFFTSAWFEQELSFEGYRDGQLLFASDFSFLIDTFAPQWIGLGWRGIDTLAIYNSSGTQWVMDDFTVPEPGMLALFGIGAAGCMLSRRRILSPKGDPL